MLMKNRHFFEDSTYLVSNHSVASHPLFYNQAVQDYFKSKMEQFLEGICDIISYSLNDQEFQILVHLRDRGSFEKSFLKKNPYWDGTLGIPESTYIFSQAMANLQGSVAKYVNKDLGKRGTVFDSRFDRQLVTSQEELEALVEELNKGQKKYSFGSRWCTKLAERCAAMTGEWIERCEGDEIPGPYVLLGSQDLGLNFSSLPPLSIPPEKRRFGYEFFRLLKQRRKKKR